MKLIGTLLITSLCLACAATQVARNLKKAIDYWVAGFAYDMCTLRGGADCKAP